MVRHAIPAAAKQHPQVEAVIRTFESAPGTFQKIHTTTEALKKEQGSDTSLVILDTHMSSLLFLKAQRMGGKSGMFGDSNKVLAL